MPHGMGFILEQYGPCQPVGNSSQIVGLFQSPCIFSSSFVSNLQVCRNSVLIGHVMTKLKFVREEDTEENGRIGKQNSQPRKSVLPLVNEINEALWNVEYKNRTKEPA